MQVASARSQAQVASAWSQVQLAWSQVQVASARSQVQVASARSQVQLNCEEFTSLLRAAGWCRRAPAPGTGGSRVRFPPGPRRASQAARSNLHKATAEQLAQSKLTVLRRATCAEPCTDQFAQSALPRATCAEQLTQSNLHRVSCTEQLAQSNLHKATCAEQLAQNNL